VFYIEGDKGHLMTEEVFQKKFRTVARGLPMSFHMPTQDILQDLRRKCADPDLTEIPRPEECLKYLLRVHLRAAKQDLAKHLRQVHVRPFVVLELLYFLIARNHEVFHGKGDIEFLRQRMREAVAREYPETEEHLPKDDRCGHIPKAILETLAMSPEEEEMQQERRSKLPRLMQEKNATPGDAMRSVEKCLDDVRPFAIALDRTVSACTDPATLREAALERYGELEVQTGCKAISQWNTQYFSLVLPFVIPRMVSGPDFDPRNRWRRTFDDAPIVTPRAFAAGFIRRVEAPCRLD
jgi:hypothetical protein